MDDYHRTKRTTFHSMLVVPVLLLLFTFSISGLDGLPLPGEANVEAEETMVLVEVTADDLITDGTHVDYLDDDDEDPTLRPECSCPGFVGCECFGGVVPIYDDEL